MEQSKTMALRPVSKKVNDCLGDIPNGSFNFGLYFNKWFCLVDKDSNGDRWKRGDQWNCSLSDLTEVVGNRNDDCCDPNIQLENFAVSLALFNSQQSITREKPVRNNKNKWIKQPKDIKVDRSWDSKSANDLLKSKHQDLESVVRAYTSLGYTNLPFEATLKSPLVIGLGNEHPTEKGFLFDWNMGIPYIPASSIKGVVRLATMVNKLNEFNDPDGPDMLRYLENIKKDDTMPEPMKALFGAGGDKSSQRGKVIFLDAYPEKLPKLKAEIMNCHYPDYLNKSERGPTEDQSPNPQRYWAVDKLDRSNKPLKFVFRMIVCPDVAQNTDHMSSLKAAFVSGLADHGLGAKTAVGHGRFGIKNNTHLLNTAVATESNNSPSGMRSDLEYWEKVELTFDPSRRQITALRSGKKATTGNTGLVPDMLRKKLLEKPKHAVANVKVEQKGKDYYIIVKIEP